MGRLSFIHTAALPILDSLWNNPDAGASFDFWALDNTPGEQRPNTYHSSVGEAASVPNNSFLELTPVPRSYRLSRLIQGVQDLAMSHKAYWVSDR